MNKMKQKNRIYFFFSLIFTLLIASCGIKNYKGFVEEDARFANYTFLDYDNAGLAYYVDETNPNDIAVAIGTCTAENVSVSAYTEEVDGVPTSRDVTSVFPSGFQNCDTIKKITLPDTVTTFGTDAFAGSSLETITLPKNLTAISSGAFRNCKDLTSVKFKTGNLLATINDYAFANCYNLDTFSFHEIKNLKTIGREAFLYCLKLTSVVFPEGFVTLESYAFQDCKGLTTIYFPASTGYVATNAFRGVGESAKIYFSEEEPGSGSSSSSSASSSKTPVSLASDFNFSYGDYYIPVVYGVGAMKFVDDFQFITPEGGDYKIVECNYGENEGDWSPTDTRQFPEHIASDEVVLLGYTGVTPNAELDIPATILGGAYKVVGIKSQAFMDKTNIKKVTFHENLRFIDYGAFSGCTSLTDIDLRGAVDLQHIQSRAFFDTMPSAGGTVGELRSIHIPANVQNIEGDAFRNCQGLFRLYFDGAATKYEEAFLCPADGDFTFKLGYVPSGITSVTFDGPAVSYTRGNDGVSITIAGCRQGGVARVIYTTNNTTTQTFTGHEDDNGALVKTFVLAGDTDDGSIGTVTVNDVPVSPSGYSIDNTGGKSKIVFNTAPADEAEIVVSYSAQSKLTKIQTCAFYGCSSGFGDSSFDGIELRQADNPFSNIYFPDSLQEIGKSAFAGGQFIGGVTFKSDELEIKENAFSGQKALSSITFPDSVTGLTLGKKCFAYAPTLTNLSECVAGNLYKKLISVTLPENTTVTGTDIFQGRFFAAIYCIGNAPTGTSKWDRRNESCGDDGKNGTLESFGSFSSDAIKNELDFIPVYKVNSTDDIISLPSKDHPIFDFVKEQGKNYATLTNYHNYGGRIKDQDGDTAITMGRSLTTNDQDDINDAYDSEYAVPSGDGHFKFMIPYQVTFDDGANWLDVKTIGKAALAIQFNCSDMHPRGCGPQSNKDYKNTNAHKYWKAGENFWTMKEIYLPNSITTISDIAMAFVSFTTVKSYKNTGLTDSSDDKAKIWNNSSGALLGDGKFPEGLTFIGKKAFAFSAITAAKIPDCLATFGSITGNGTPDTNNSYFYFPFMGCFELSVLELYSVGTASPTFTGGEGSGAISHRNSKKLLEGAGAKTSFEIEWGTTQMVAGALRGGRKVVNILFPYTLTAISKNFLDTIGNAVDSEGRSGKSDLESVRFGGISQYPNAVDNNPKTVPQCTSIGRSAFYGSSKLKTVEFPNSLTELGQWAFYGCESLDTISIDRGDTLGDTTPSSHLDLSQIQNLSTIGQECFINCKKIKEVTTPSALTWFKSKGAFNGCSGLETLNLNSATQNLGQETFKACSKLTSVTFTCPSGNTLGDNCFNGCSLLSSITFDGTTNTIGSSCFSGCKALTSVTFAANDASATFNNNAFSGCTGLQSITVPDGSFLNQKVFNGCTGLKTGGIILGEGVSFASNSTGSNSAFAGCVDAKIFLMDSDETYVANQTGSGARYPSGWNYRDGTNPLTFYCYSATQPQNPLPNFHYWEDEDHDGVPHIWQ
ncbi:MAG: leucine-rich repeat protein [Bacilli bacterium]|nr:leucine-rich repeat protein [Bacilli bacterium]